MHIYSYYTMIATTVRHNHPCRLKGLVA